MKRILSLLMLIHMFMNFAHAEEKIITVDANNKNETLRHVPQLMMASFVDQGFKQTESQKNVWNLTIKNLRCDTQTRDVLFPDNRLGGLPSVKCYVNASNIMYGKGTPISEARYIENLISTLERLIPDAQYSDCILGGRCAVFIKEINCTSDMTKEEMHDAFKCEFKSDMDQRVL